MLNADTHLCRNAGWCRVDEWIFCIKQEKYFQDIDDRLMLDLAEYHKIRMVDCYFAFLEDEKPYERESFLRS